MPKLSDIMRHGGPTLADVEANPERYATELAQLGEDTQKLLWAMERFWEVRERAARAVEEGENGFSVNDR